MNKQDFNIINGFPMNQAALDRMQSSWWILNAFGNIVGDKTIISGCTGTSTVSNGVVYVNGELFEFRGGVQQSTVYIKEDISYLVYKDNNSYPAVKTRYVTFGTGVGQMDWADFKRGFETKNIPSDLNDRLTIIEKKLAIFQPGGVVFPWFKPVADIPAGFQEVVDIRGRTIIGYDPAQDEFKPIGKKAGSKTQSLTKANLAEHDHFEFADETVDAGLVISATNQPVKEGYNAGGDGNQNYRIRGTNNPATVGKTSKVGNGEAFSILNPYAIAAYIEYIG